MCRQSLPPPLVKGKASHEEVTGVRDDGLDWARNRWLLGQYEYPRPTRPRGAQVIYQISEEKAFTSALKAYAILLPKQSVDDVVEGSRRGYSADERWGLDYWTHRVIVVPAVGTDASGNEVHGYWYDISGSGTLIPSEEGKARFLRFIRTRLDGTGTVITNVRDGKYETDGRAYLGLKRDARDIKLGSRTTESGAAERLSELKTMRDRDSFQRLNIRRSVSRS